MSLCVPLKVCHVSAFSAKENVMLSNIAQSCFPVEYQARQPEVAAAKVLSVKPDPNPTTPPPLSLASNSCLQLHGFSYNYQCHWHWHSHAAASAWRPGLSADLNGPIKLAHACPRVDAHRSGVDRLSVGHYRPDLRIF